MILELWSYVKKRLTKKFYRFLSQTNANLKKNSTKNAYLVFKRKH